jgi:hypothetical protein
VGNRLVTRVLGVKFNKLVVLKFEIKKMIANFQENDNDEANIQKLMAEGEKVRKTLAKIDWPCINYHRVCEVHKEDPGFVIKQLKSNKILRSPLKMRTTLCQRLIFYSSNGDTPTPMRFLCIAQYLGGLTNFIVKEKNIAKNNSPRSLKIFSRIICSKVKHIHDKLYSYTLRHKSWLEEKKIKHEQRKETHRLKKLRHDFDKMIDQTRKNPKPPLSPFLLKRTKHY